MKSKRPPRGSWNHTRVRVAPVAAAFAVACVLAGVGVALAAGAPSVKLLSSRDDGFDVEFTFPAPEVRASTDHSGYHVVSMPGMVSPGAAGEPSLPRFARWFALPPGIEPADITLAIEARDDAHWDGIRPLPIGQGSFTDQGSDLPDAWTESFEEDPDAYGRGIYPPERASLVGGSQLRYLRVHALSVAPIVWDASTGTLSAASKVVVRVRFGEPRGERAGMLERAVARDDEPWQKLYDDTILNADRAVAWGRAPGVARSLRGPAEPAGTHVRLGVRKTGIRRVGFEDVNVPAWSGASLATLRLFDRFHDTDDAPESPVVETEVPIAIVDGDESGTWTEGDFFTFYAQNLPDRRPDLPVYIQRYGTMHAYWLTLREGAVNARMEATGSWLGREDLTPVTSYPWTEKFTRDSDPLGQGVYGKMGSGGFGYPIDRENDLAGGVTAVRSIHAYWLGDQPYDPESNSNRYTVTFDLPGFSSIERFTGRWQGLRRPNADEHRVVLGLQAGPADTTLERFPSMVRFRWQDSTRVSFEGPALRAMSFREEDNILANLLPPTYDGSGLDWFAVAYTRSAKFFEGSVTLSTAGRAGPTEFEVASSPTGDDLIGFEITDPLHPRLLTIDGTTQVYTGTGGPPRPRFLRLQWDLADGAERRFFVSRASEGLLPPEEIETIEWPALASPGDQDYVVIAPRAWFDSLEPLLEHRASQGRRILRAPIEDVYAEFAGGHRWPHAMRSFLRTLFRTRGVAPSYLLLVGDASDGFDNKLPDSDPNFVPTQTMFSNSYTGREGPELGATDQWFVDNLAGSGETLDFLPDMFVGRLSADDPNAPRDDRARQLGNIIQKLMAYENFQADDSWRNRVLFVSDDEWSSTISFGESYCRQPSEWLFKASADRSQEVIETYGKLPGFGIDRFDLACYMDTVDALGRCAREVFGTCVCEQYNDCANYETSRVYGEQVVAPKLWSAMSRGHLFVSYNGHANARLMTHEYIFRHSPLTSRQDVHQLGNLGRPFIFMGYGCHLAEFSAVDEALGTRADAIPENMMFLYPDRGAVAGIASTGYEWLNWTDKYNLAVVEAFFKNPPQIDGRTRWVLGDVFGRSKANVLAYGPDSQTFQSMANTYTMLGDPGMIMDSDAPRMQVRLDGAAIEPGTPLVLPAGHDSITFEVRVRDEVGTAGFEVRDAGGVVDPARYSVTPDADGDRGFTATYRTTIRAQSYAIGFTATDANARVRSVSFPVQTVVAFEWLREGREWRILPPGSTIARGDSLRARLELPIWLAEGDVRFLVDGDSAAARRTPDGLQDGRSRVWTLTLLDDVMGAPQRTLSIGIDTPEGGTLVLPDTPVDIKTESVPLPPDFRIQVLYSVPNPFKDQAWFFYSVPYEADEVAIRIYTASGKLVRTLRGLPAPQLEDDPPVAWDGKDEDGDDVGNGLYFYRMTVRGNGRDVSRIEKLARVR